MRREHGELLVTVTGRTDGEDGSRCVTAELVDAAGEPWTFALPDPFGPDAELPRPHAIRCTVVRDEMVGGILMVHIDTAEPDGIESVDGVTRFRVLRALVT